MNLKVLGRYFMVMGLSMVASAIFGVPAVDITAFAALLYALDARFGDGELTP